MHLGSIVGNYKRRIILGLQHLVSKTLNGHHFSTKTFDRIDMYLIIIVSFFFQS